jgi:hypothetical protein
MKKASFKWYEEGKPDNDHPLLNIDKTNVNNNLGKHTELID